LPYFIYLLLGFLQTLSVINFAAV